MRVLQINAVCGYASTGRTCVEMADGLKKKGHECFIAYGNGESDYQNSYKIGTNIGVMFHGLFSRIFGLQGYFSKLATKKLIRYINKISPDIVQLRNLHSNYLHIPILLNYLSKNDVATVITLHDCFLFTGKCSHYTVDKCDGWKKQCGKCVRLKKDNVSCFFDRTKKMLSDKKNGFSKINNLATVGVSKWITNEAKKSILSCSKYILPIYNWVDMEIFKPINNDLKIKMGAEDKFIVLGVASKWMKSKGIFDFINLSAKIDKDTMIILIGKIDEDITLPGNIISIPNTNNTKELAEYYSACDVLFNPSIEETFGKVTAESLACGTPVVVYNTTACPELVGERCGAVVELNDVQSAFEQIQIIKKNKKVFYSEACINFARENFDKDIQIQKYIDLYLDMLQS